MADWTRVKQIAENLDEAQRVHDARFPKTHQVVDIKTGVVMWKDTLAGCITWMHSHQGTGVVFAYDGRRLGVIDGRGRYDVEPLPEGGKR